MRDCSGIECTFPFPANSYDGTVGPPGVYPHITPPPHYEEAAIPNGQT